MSTTPQSAPPPATPPPTHSLWDDIVRLGIYRDRRAGWLAGVCAGLAHRLGVDPLLIRAAAIVLGLLGGFGVVAYLVAWLVLPDTEGQILLREVGSGNGTAIGLLIVLGIVVIGRLPSGDGSWRVSWFVPLLIVAIWLIIRAARAPSASRGTLPSPATPGTPASPAAQADTATGGPPMTLSPTTGSPLAAGGLPDGPGAASGMPSGDGRAAVPPTIPPVPTPAQPPRPPRPQRRTAPRGTSAVILGAVVLAYGLGYLLDGPTGFPGSPHLLGLIAAMTIAGIAALVLGLSGRRGGLASVLVLVLLLPLAGSAGLHRYGLVTDGGESVTWVPSATGDVRELGVGTLTLDLGSVTAGGAPSQTASAGSSPGVRASVGTGDLVILVPAGVELHLDAQVGLGSVDFGPLAAVDVRGGAVGSQSRTGADGFAINRSVVLTRPAADGSTPKAITVSAQVGVGQITVKEK